MNNKTTVTVPFLNLRKILKKTLWTNKFETKGIDKNI